MITGFIHKGLKALFEKGSTKGINHDHKKKLQRQLTLLNVATSADDMNLPGFGLHELQGGRAGIWSIKVNGNWRMTFRFNDENAEIVNYEDYH